MTTLSTRLSIPDVPLWTEDVFDSSSAVEEAMQNLEGWTPPVSSPPAPVHRTARRSRAPRRRKRERKQSWPRWVRIGLIVLALLVGRRIVSDVIHTVGEIATQGTVQATR